MVLVFLKPVYAQDDTQSYSKFRALLQTGERIEIENGIGTLSLERIKEINDLNDDLKTPIKSGLFYKIDSFSKQHFYSYF